MKHILPLAFLALLATAQTNPAQAPQINAATQLKNLPNGGGDNWLSFVPTGIINGTNAIFTIPIAARSAAKVRPELNGAHEYQAAELPSGAAPNVSVVVGIGVTTITFLSPTPAVGDVVSIWATQ